MLHIRRIEADELPIWHAIRTQVYLERGYVTAQQLNAASLFVDSHDIHAQHIGAFSADEMIGTFRLIFRGNPSGLLPVEELFGRILPAHVVAVEPSGLAVLKEYRSFTGLAFVGLLRGIFELAVEAGADFLYPVLEMQMIRWLQSIGFPIDTISEPRNVYNSENWATCCSVGNLVESIEKKDRSRSRLKYGPVFANPFDGWLTEDDIKSPRPKEL
jgi:N-acyl-L-homoserine lactone synthetase